MQEKRASDIFRRRIIKYFVDTTVKIFTSEFHTFFPLSFVLIILDEANR